MKFNYQARTKTGEVQSGVVEASSKEAAVSTLQRYGLYITALESVETIPFYARSIKFFGTISHKERVLFSRQLSIMFASRVPLIESLRTLSSQTRNPNFRERISDISDDVEAGNSLSSAVSKYPEIFSPFYVAMIKAGEASGKLSESLNYLAEHMEREYNLISRLRGAMFYPALVVVIFIFVLGVMLFYIIPQLVEVMEQIGQELPTITKIAIASTTFLREYILLFILILFFLITSAFAYYRTKAGRTLFDISVLKLPFIGNFLRLVYLSQFAENLSTLISGGLPIAQCLELSGKIVTNSVYQKIIFKTRDEVRKGKQVSETLAHFPEDFPPVFCQMCLVGEKSGTLDSTLGHLVDFYQKETERTADNLIGILEPLLIIILGALVGGLILAFLIPLYQMASFE